MIVDKNDCYKLKIIRVINVYNVVIMNYFLIKF